MPIRQKRALAGMRRSLFDRFFDRGKKSSEWVARGCPSPAPPYVKARIVRSYLTQFDLRNFVETGTFRGDTLAFIADTGVSCTSIELSEELFENAQERFSGRANVHLLHGDSGALMGHLATKLEIPTLFWLDGHYSGGVTARGTKDSPVSEELNAVLSHPIKKHVILIDDARCFDGTDGYPRLIDLLHRLDQLEAYRWELSCDMIRITPRAAEQ